MNILVISQYWSPENGVPQRRWSWLTGNLVKSGHKVLALAPPPHYAREIKTRDWWKTAAFKSARRPEKGNFGEDVYRTAFFPAGQSITQRILNQATVGLGALWVILRRPLWLRNFRPDLIIGTVPALPTAFVTFLASRILKIPYVIDLRDAWPDLLSESEEWNRATGRKSLRERFLTKGPFQLLRFLTRVSVNKSLKEADAILVTSSFLAADLRERPELHDGKKVPNVLTIRNLFPPESVPSRRHDVAALRPWGQLNVLYAGTLGRAQNLQNVLEAFEIAKSMGVDVRLRMIGAGASRESLTARIQERGLGIVIEGRKKASELREAYEWADTALVHLTDWEPLKRAVPSKTYELMSSKVHISGVISGETAELIRNLGAGHVVAPEAPEDLAQMWFDLATKREDLNVSDRGAEWVSQQRDIEIPARLNELVESIGESRD